MEDYTRFRATLQPHQVNPHMPTEAPEPNHPIPTNLPPEEDIIEVDFGQIGGALVEESDELDYILERNQGGIRSYKRKGKVWSLANFKIFVDGDVNQDLSEIPEFATTSYRQNLVAVSTMLLSTAVLHGFIVQHKTKGIFTLLQTIFLYLTSQDMFEIL